MRLISLGVFSQCDYLHYTPFPNVLNLIRRIRRILLMATKWVKNAHKKYYFLTMSDDLKGAESRKNLTEVLNPGLVRINFKD
jgi:hypothetical protein